MRTQLLALVALMSLSYSLACSNHPKKPGEASDASGTQSSMTQSMAQQLAKGVRTAGGSQAAADYKPQFTGESSFFGTVDGENADRWTSEIQ